jgi:hypothetical protein
MAMIGWEDRDAAGRTALMGHLKTGRTGIGWHWVEIVLCAGAVTVALSDWAVLARALMK